MGFLTGVLAGNVISNDKFIFGEFKNWLGENGNGFIGVTFGDNMFIPAINVFIELLFILEFKLLCIFVLFIELLKPLLFPVIDDDSDEENDGLKAGAVVENIILLLLKCLFCKTKK